MKILVSGARGSFGSHLVKTLTEYDTISPRYGQMNKQDSLKLSTCDVFIHCGALLSGSFTEMFEANVLLTKNILDQLSLSNPEAHFIYFSSMSLLQAQHNISSSSFRSFEKMTDYAVSKYLSEIICSRYGLPITIVRFSTIFFKDPQRDGLSKLIHDAVLENRITLYNDGSAKRDFIPIDIAALYVKQLIGDQRYYGRTLNISSCRETTFKEIALFLQAELPQLFIENKSVDLDDCVPTSFDCGDLITMGKLEFDLFAEIAKYKAELEASLESAQRGEQKNESHNKRA
ncbi:MAG: NAD-dependent epimerase/dehydratase family protein [Halobacteriota archaeon]